MAERPNQNWESRDIFSLGPKFRIDINNPQMGFDGTDVYTIYGVTDNKDVAIAGLTEGGTYKIYNDKSIELVAGSKGTEGGIDIVIAGMNGDITITAMKNGQVRIKGANVMIQADEDVDIKAGRNINLNASNGRILLKSNKADCNALVGNLAEATTGSFVQRVFLGTKVGPDFLISDGIVSGIGNLPNVVANVAGGLFG
jgi:hypothetical protein